MTTCPSSCQYAHCTCIGAYFVKKQKHSITVLFATRHQRHKRSFRADWTAKIPWASTNGWSLKMTWATTVAQHAGLDVATTHVSCKAKICFGAPVIYMNEHLGSNWININPLATISYGWTHCIVLNNIHCGSIFFIVYYNMQKHLITDSSAARLQNCTHLYQAVWITDKLCTSLTIPWATTVVRHAVLGIATTRVSCKANTCVGARIASIKVANRISSHKILLNTLDK